MSTLQNNTTTTTTYNDGSQVKTTDFSKKSTLLNETDSGKPEFEYNKPAPTTMGTTSVTTGSSAIHDTPYQSTTTTTNYGTSTNNPSQSKTEQLKQKAVEVGHQIEGAFNHASQSINNAIASHRSQPSNTTTTTQPTYNTTTTTQPVATTSTTTTTEHTGASKGGLGSKLSDMMAHVGAALHQGHPVHAVTNATTAAKVGECERIKHERGPLADTEAGTTHNSSLDNPNFNAAGQPYDNVSSAALTHPTNTTTLNQPNTYSAPTTTTYNQSTAYTQPTGTTTQYTTKEKLHDMASHASAQLHHGNPITAIADAPAAARIAEAEKMKHQKGPIAGAPENDSAGLVSGQSSTSQSIPSGTGTGSFGGVTGISGQGGAASTQSQYRNY